VKLPILRDHRTIVPCTACAFRAECGGLDDQQSLWGCFSACSVDCIPRSCDWTCPANPADFIERMRDVGGFSNDGVALKPLGDAALPSYVPMIHHGYGLGSDDEITLDAKVAAISIKDVFRARYDGRLEVVADDPVSLRRHFGLHEDSTKDAHPVESPPYAPRRGGALSTGPSGRAPSQRADERGLAVLEGFSVRAP
jgi:hypothetical protein